MRVRVRVRVRVHVSVRVGQQGAGQQSADWQLVVNLESHVYVESESVCGSGGRICTHAPKCV